MEFNAKLGVSFLLSGGGAFLLYLGDGLLAADELLLIDFSMDADDFK